MASTLANTCYEAELPLSMAAWNCDYATVDTLLEFGASIAAKNCQGDNIFHGLIKVWLSEPSFFTHLQCQSKYHSLKIPKFCYFAFVFLKIGTLKTKILCFFTF